MKKYNEWDESDLLSPTIRDRLNSERCRFQRIVYRSEGGDFMAAVYAFEKEAFGTFSVAGSAPPSEKNVVYEIVSGEWKIRSSGEKKYLSLENGALRADMTRSDSLVAFLCTIKSVGKATAKRIVEHYKEKTFDALEEAYTLTEKGLKQDQQPERLAYFYRTFKNKRLDYFMEGYREQIPLRQAYEFFSGTGLTGPQITKLIKKYGAGAVGAVKENPYVLSRMNVPFSLADDLALKLGFEESSKERIKGGVMEALRQAEKGGGIFQRAEWQGTPLCESGHTYITFEPMEKALEILFGKSYPEAKGALLAGALLEMHEGSLIRCVNLIEGEGKSAKAFAIYSMANYVAEADGARRLAAHIGSFSEKGQVTIKQLLSEKESAAIAKKAAKELGLDLTEKQSKAVISSLMHPVSIISGYAGTGKTTVIKAVIKAYELRGKGAADVRLVAPTGKAAKRMEEATGLRASTIHSFLKLGYKDEGDEELLLREEGECFSCDLLIVDEMSMVDNRLFFELMKRLSPETKLLFVGDTGQLPSIGAGLVLKEIIGSGVVPVTALDEIMRQAEGSSIIKNAEIIWKGNAGRMTADGEFVYIPKRTSSEIAEKIVSLAVEKIKEHGVENVAVITPFRRKTETGSNALNLEIRRRLNPLASAGAPQPFYRGDRVMFTKNAGDLTNGDMGYVIKAGKDKEGAYSITVKFDNGIELNTDSPELMRDVVLGYAMSVHKSQGSEYHCVILAIDPAHKRMLKQNLLYTAVTRAKSQLVLVGDGKAFGRGVKTKDAGRRNTRLSARLKIALKKLEKPTA